MMSRLPDKPTTHMESKTVSGLSFPVRLKLSIEMFSTKRELSVHLSIYIRLCLENVLCRKVNHQMCRFMIEEFTFT